MYKGQFLSQKIFLLNNFQDYTCECYDGWVGQACDCEASQDQCITGNDVCHGNGQCKCNQCKCDTFDTGFFTQSDKCETFKSGCEQHAPCAQCSYYGFLNGGPMDVPESVDPDLDCSQCEGKYHDIKENQLLNYKDHQGLCFISIHSLRMNGNFSSHCKSYKITLARKITIRVGSVYYGPENAVLNGRNYNNRLNPSFSVIGKR